MKRFLSIDWDFFVDADLNQREFMFPDGGNENLPTSIRDYIWDSCYIVPDLINIGVTPDYKMYLSMCRSFEHQPVMITDSHKHAFNFFMNLTSPDEHFEVYNIDFHHDLYNYRTGSERVNCGNWGTILKEERPNMDFIWVKHKDSSTKVIGDYEVECKITDIKQLCHKVRGDFSKFDALFLCRSSLWSPPHLDKKFLKGVNIIRVNCPDSEYEQSISTPRPYEVSHEIPLF